MLRTDLAAEDEEAGVGRVAVHTDELALGHQAVLGGPGQLADHLLVQAVQEGEHAHGRLEQHHHRKHCSAPVRPVVARSQRGYLLTWMCSTSCSLRSDGMRPSACHDHQHAFSHQYQATPSDVIHTPVGP